MAAFDQAIGDYSKLSEWNKDESLEPSFQKTFTKYEVVASQIPDVSISSRVTNLPDFQLRESTCAIARAIDKANRILPAAFIFQFPTDAEAVVCEVAEIRMREDGSPVMLVRYLETELSDAVKVTPGPMESVMQRAKSTVMISCGSADELVLLKELLSSNSNKMTFESQAIETGLQFTFLSPDYNKVNTEAEKEKAKKVAQDKTTTTSTTTSKSTSKPTLVNTNNSVVVPVDTPTDIKHPLANLMSGVSISHANAKVYAVEKGVSPENEHGEQFLVKIQANDRESPVMLYDETRAVHRLLFPEEIGYASVCDAILANEVLKGQKKYFIAQREGANLRIVLQPEAPQDLKW